MEEAAAGRENVRSAWHHGYRGSRVATKEAAARAAQERQEHELEKQRHSAINRRRLAESRSKWSRVEVTLGTRS